eukprot:scaffold163298_cov19-Prasinocladus_malaysianus.AAC.2
MATGTVLNWFGPPFESKLSLQNRLVATRTILKKEQYLVQGDWCRQTAVLAPNAPNAYEYILFTVEVACPPPPREQTSAATPETVLVRYGYHRCEAGTSTRLVLVIDSNPYHTYDLYRPRPSLAFGICRSGLAFIRTIYNDR